MLELLQQLHDTGTLKWIGTCSELNASYAADGYARLIDLGAWASAHERDQRCRRLLQRARAVICIAGSIPLRSIDRGLPGIGNVAKDGNGVAGSYSGHVPLSASLDRYRSGPSTAVSLASGMSPKTATPTGFIPPATMDT